MHIHLTSWEFISDLPARLFFDRAAKCGHAPFVDLRTHGYGVSAPARALIRYTTRAHVCRSGLLLPTNVYLLVNPGGSCRKPG